MTRKAQGIRHSRQAIVALGASAGGLESLGALLAALRGDFPAPILVALHLDPKHRSQVVVLLQRRTQLRVVAAQAGARPRRGVVYVAPPDHHLAVDRGQLRVTRGPRVNFSRPSIDVLFESVAAAYGPAAIAAVLSGTGSDGTVGTMAVKARGGLALAEDPETAAFGGMPASAAATGVLDAVLPIGQVPAYLTRAAQRGVPVTSRQWADLLTRLERQTGARFRAYRLSTLHRRLQQRILARDCRTMAEYVKVLDTDPEEVLRLRAAFLIKVSTFFRDPDFWHALARVVPRLRATQGADLRAWSAGCATGEEAYSLAILLARSFGVGPAARWKVFGTDLDEGALSAARIGKYREAQLFGVSAHDRRRFFVRDGDAWQVDRELRSHVVFGRHDILRDPLLPPVDILSCRNVLIYVDRPEKRRALERFRLAVKPGGILFLGATEALTDIPGFERAGRASYFQRTRIQKGMRPRKGHPPQDDDAPRAAKGWTGVRSVDRRRDRRASPNAPVELRDDLTDELQSRNEELETVNEELQSLNDEMSAMEDEMRKLIEESETSNEFLRLLLDLSSKPYVACDAENRVVFWNKAAAKRFHLTASQAVGGNLFTLVGELRKKPLRDAARQVRGPGPRHVVVRSGRSEYTFDGLPAQAGKARGYLLRVGPGKE